VFNPLKQVDLYRPEADGKLTANNFIHDLIASFLQMTEADTEWAIEALLIAFEVVARPLLEKGESLPRDEVLSLGKLLAEVNGVPPYLIMLIGRWSSEAFLLYIRKAVEQFEHDVSKIMIKNPTYHHVLIQEKDDPRRTTTPANNYLANSRSQVPLTAYEVWSM